MKTVALRTDVNRLLSEEEAIKYLGLTERRNPKGALRWIMRVRKLGYVKLGRGIFGFRKIASRPGMYLTNR
jgi:hypothetical protein